METPERALIVIGDPDVAAYDAGYAGVPPDVRDACEGRWMAAQSSLVDALRANRDDLAPYGTWKDWCAGHGVDYKRADYLLNHHNWQPVLKTRTESLPEPAVSEMATALQAAVDRQPEELREAVRARLATAAPALITSLANDVRADVQRERRRREYEALAAEWIDPDYRVELADIADVSLTPGSVDAIVSDPPYLGETLAAYGILAAKAATWLKPGGSLVMMAGQAHWPAIFEYMEGCGLRWHWSLVYLLSGPAQQLFQRRVISRWKPLLWFVNGSFTGTSVDDVIVGAGRDKEWHRWGQDVPGFQALIEAFTRPGDLVCDPFVGGGTTAVAAYQSGRRFVGFDIDPACVATTRGRLAELHAERVAESEATG